MNKAEQEELQQKLKGIVSNLPEKPGSYQYYDEEGTIIYVGKPILPSPYRRNISHASSKRATENEEVPPISAHTVTYPQCMRY